MRGLKNNLLILRAHEMRDIFRYIVREEGRCIRNQMIDIYGEEFTSKFMDFLEMLRRNPDARITLTDKPADICRRMDCPFYKEDIGCTIFDNAEETGKVDDTNCARVWKIELHKVYLLKDLLQIIGNNLPLPYLFNRTVKR